MWLSVIGPVGVGKKKIIEMISVQKGYFPIYEDTGKYFNEFNIKSEEFAFRHQLEFLKNKYRSQRDIKNLRETKDIVSSRVIWEVVVFSEVLFEIGILKKYEFDFIRELTEELDGALNTPDGVIYVRSDIRSTHNRKLLDDNICFFTNNEYIKLLNEKYEEFSRRISVPVIEVDVTKNFDNLWNDVSYGIDSLITTGVGNDSVWGSSFLR